MKSAIGKMVLALTIPLACYGTAVAGVYVSRPTAELHGAWFDPAGKGAVVLFGKTAGPDTLRWTGVDASSFWQGECRLNDNRLACVAQGSSEMGIQIIESAITHGKDDSGEYLDEKWSVISGGETKLRGENRLRRFPGATPKPAEFSGDYDASKAQWMASLRHEEGQHLCGGVLVAPQWVLTAAHCVGADIFEHSKPSVVLGGGRLDDTSQPNLEVAKVVLHPEWSGRAHEGHNLALLQLAKPSEITPITLGRQNRGLAESAPDGRTYVTALGWVDKLPNAHGKRELKQVLQYAKLPLISEEHCKHAYGDSIQPDMFCAGFPEGGADSCMGDSGGPVISRGSTPRLMGLISWGDGCGLPGKYGVSTSIAYYMDWIRQTADLPIALTPTR